MNFMHITKLSYLPWLILILLIMLLPVSLSDPRTTQAEFTCGQNASPSNDIYYLVFVTLEDVSWLVTNNTWGLSSANTTNTLLYALAQCYQDLSQTDCRLCYAEARSRVNSCLPSDAARLHLDGCFLRYDTYDFSIESVDQSKDNSFCSNSTGGSIADGGASFKNDAEGLIDNLTRKAVSSGGYAVEGSRGVYGLAQCWKTLSRSGCEECLTKASKEVKGCLPMNEGKGLNAGCYLRYSNEKFYNDRPQDTGGSVSLSDPRTTQAELTCGQNASPSNNSYYPVFVQAMEGVSQLVTNNTWGFSLANTTNTSVYALAQCYQDLSRTDCLLCYAAARTRVPSCLPADAARLHLDGCFLRYDTYDFSIESVDQSKDNSVCSNSTGGSIADGGASFKIDAEGLIDNLARKALSSGGYAVEGERGVYGLAQCWKTLNRSGCEECLTKASKGVKGCLPMKEGRGLNAGCYLRYSNEKFYNDPSQDTGGSGIKTGVVVAIVLGVAGFCMFSVFFAYAGYARLKKLKQERKNLGHISHLYNKSNLNFKYEILEKATNYFDPSRKLGQGGAGSVYKGTLSNGKVVAVKRLFFNTRQWVDDFFNEVNLVSGIQHKNLVKLLGCSIEGPESLLVYEFIPNKSLDHYLYEKEKVKILNWKERFNIIVGTAEGLAFLHGGSEIRIIHRDIKSSNVLLDENLSPKIADFGLARHFAADKTHLSTGIAGTLGYMAPEYLVRGQLTEKADVYSYGVLVLEIVCGRKNIAFVEESGSLLQTVWKLNQSNNLTEAVDPSLNGNFPPNEAAEVLQIALLCTQASIALRPSMAEVIQMLTDKNCPIPVANQPPFINASMLTSGPIRPGSILAPNALSKIEISTTSTESSSIQSSDGPSRSS